MKSSDAINYAVIVKQEANDMCYDEKKYSALKDQTSETKHLQYLRCLQESTNHTLEKHEDIRESQPNQEIKIEFECKDVKPNVNLLQHSLIKIKDDTIVKDEFLGQTILINDTHTDCKLNGKNAKIDTLVSKGNKKSIECERYLKKFLTKINLKAHIDSEHNRIKYPCHNCEKEFKSKRYLKLHIDSVHSGRKPYNCDVCEKTFTQKGSLKSHIHSVHDCIKHPCTTCGKTFKNKGYLKLHNDSVHSGISYPCDICGKLFAYRHDVKSHLNSVHNGMRYPCHTCEKTFSHKSGLKKHIDSVHDSIKHPCQTCGKMFSR